MEKHPQDEVSDIYKTTQSGYQLAQILKRHPLITEANDRNKLLEVYSRCNQMLDFRRKKADVRPLEIFHPLTIGELRELSPAQANELRGEASSESAIHQSPSIKKSQITAVSEKDSQKLPNQLFKSKYVFKTPVKNRKSSLINQKYSQKDPVGEYPFSDMRGGYKQSQDRKQLKTSFMSQLTESKGDLTSSKLLQLEKSKACQQKNNFEELPLGYEEVCQYLLKNQSKVEKMSETARTSKTINEGEDWLSKTQRVRGNSCDETFISREGEANKVASLPLNFSRKLQTLFELKNSESIGEMSLSSHALNDSPTCKEEIFNFGRNSDHFKADKTSNQRIGNSVLQANQKDQSEEHEQSARKQPRKNSTGEYSWRDGANSKGEKASGLLIRIEDDVQEAEDATHFTSKLDRIRGLRRCGKDQQSKRLVRVQTPKFGKNHENAQTPQRGQKTQTPGSADDLIYMAFLMIMLCKDIRQQQILREGRD